MRIKLSGLDFDDVLIAELEKKLLLTGFNLDDFAFEK